MSLAKFWNRPGCGKIARSGAVPPSTSTRTCASNSCVPWYSMLMPVHDAKSAQDSLRASASTSMMVPYMLTVSPSNVPYCS